MIVRWIAAKPVRFAIPLIMSAVLVGPLLSAQTYGQDSPATGGAQVIAQGLTAPPADRSAWRVVKQEIPTRLDAVPSVRMQSSTGFLLADDVDVFVVDQRTKLRTRLAPGEAQYVPSGANQTWASLDNDAGSAYSLELVDRDLANVSPGADIVYGSDSFQTEPGDYDLDLVRDEVASGESAGVPGGTYPVLVLITSGSMTVSSTKSDEPVRLKAGQAVALRGNVTLETRGDNPATFVAAVLGDPITGGAAVPTAVPTKAATKSDRTPEATKKPKATKTPTPKPTREATADVPGIGDGASIRIAVRLCRAGMTYFGLDPRGCARANENFELSLIAPDGSMITQKDASKVDDAFVRWSGLDAGVYVLVVNAMPEGYFSYSLDGYICCTTNDGYSVTIKKDQIADGTLYLFQSAFGVGAPPTAVPVPTNVAAPQPTAVTTAPNPSLDSDGDGISDQLELDVFGTSPFLVDSDGDTIPDGTEAFGLNGWLTAPALPDTDGDGVDDNVEIQNGTNPVDASSR
jgi:Bacterial TSP3 repeat